MFALAVLLVSIATACVPLVATGTARRVPMRLQPAAPWLPVLAAVCFSGAFLLPDVHISDATESFQQHFVGGGIYTALLFAYAQQLTGWHRTWPWVVLALFAWTAAFGVASELIEFALTHLRLAAIDTTDTDWDLLANTTGSLAGYGLIRLVGQLRPFGSAVVSGRDDVA